MKGINMEDLELILKFLYFGEVMAVKRSLENFLELSTSFGDEGLEKKTCQTISNQEEPGDFAPYPEDEEPCKN